MDRLERGCIFIIKTGLNMQKNGFNVYICIPIYNTSRQGDNTIAKFMNDSVHLTNLLVGMFHEILYNCEVYRPVKEMFKPQNTLGKVVQHCILKSVAQYIRSSVEQAYRFSQTRLNLALIVLDINECPVCRFTYDISYAPDSEKIGVDGFKTLFQRLTASMSSRWSECKNSAEPHGFQIVFYVPDKLDISKSSKSLIVELNREQISSSEFVALNNTTACNGKGDVDDDGDENMRQESNSNAASSSSSSFVHRPLPLLSVRGCKLIAGIEIKT